MSVGDAEEVEVELEHGRNMFGPITGHAKKPWHEQQGVKPPEIAPPAPTTGPRTGPAPGPESGPEKGN